MVKGAHYLTKKEYFEGLEVENYMLKEAQLRIRHQFSKRLSKEESDQHHKELENLVFDIDQEDYENLKINNEDEGDIEVPSERNLKQNEDLNFNTNENLKENDEDSKQNIQIISNEENLSLDIKNMKEEMVTSDKNYLKTINSLK